MYKISSIKLWLRLSVAFVIGVVSIPGTTAFGKNAAEAEPSKAITGSLAAEDSLLKRVDSLDVPQFVAHQVVAYYFHGNVRCASCRKIEAYTKEAIDSAFGDALKCGSLEWRLVNTDSSQHEHYLGDYQLYTRSVVISDVHKGEEIRWKNLEKVWELLSNKAEFQAYIRDEVRVFMDTTK